MNNTLKRAAPETGAPAREVAFFYREIRQALNQAYFERFEVTTTLTAAATTIWQYAMSPSSAWSIDASITGIATDGSLAAYRRMVRTRRVGSAAPTVISTDTLGTDYEDVAAWAIAFDISSNNVRLRVTADATRTVTWQAMIRIDEVRY